MVYAINHDILYSHLRIQPAQRLTLRTSFPGCFVAGRRLTSENAECITTQARLMHDRVVEAVRGARRDCIYILRKDKGKLKLSKKKKQKKTDICDCDKGILKLPVVRNTAICWAEEFRV